MRVIDLIALLTELVACGRLQQDALVLDANKEAPSPDFAIGTDVEGQYIIIRA